MGQHIERDLQRFRKIVRGKVKSDLAKYISRGEMIGKRGNDLVSIPLPRSRFRSSVMARRIPAALESARARSASLAPAQGEGGQRLAISLEDTSSKSN